MQRVRRGGVPSRALAGGVVSTVLRCDDCGYTTRPSTPASAAYAIRKHSCERKRALAERSARVEQRRAASGPVRDCAHPRANHQHGTNAAYKLDRCRCRPCRDASAAYERNRTRQTIYGRWEPFIDAAPTRAHIAALRAGGLGLKRISALAGVSHSTVGKLVYGHTRDDGSHRIPSERIRRDTAERVLAVRADLDNLGSRRPVDGTGTRLRLRALVARGWSMSRLARELGGSWATSPGNLCVVVTGDEAVGAGTAVAVRDLYERLWNAAPPEHDQRTRIAASRARNYAALRGWLPPLALDDERIDDPDYLPGLEVDDQDEDAVDPVVVARIVAGESHRALGANRQERIAALRLIADRARRHADPYGGALPPGVESINDASRRLSLHMTRDVMKETA